MPDTHHAFEHVKAVYLPIAIVVFTLVVGAVLILLVRGAGRDRPGRRSNALRLELANAAALACVAAFLVVITYPTWAALGSPSDEEAITKRLYPDYDRFQKEEQRRFEILDSHWDIPLTPVVPPK